MKSVRYRVGNIGDLLKHSWLIEILAYLKKQKAASPFYHADTFSGFVDYRIGRGLSDRIKNRLSRSPLFRIQENALRQDRYYGSVTIARKVLGSSARLEVFDRNPKALEGFKGSGAAMLKIKSGYDVLKKKKPYDLIFLDENMPGLTGIETLRLVKEIRNDLPVVMITKHEEEGIMDAAIGSDIADYLIKPVKPNKILLVIKRIIEQRRLVRE